MLLTEEGAHAQVPRSPAERQKFIAAQEKAWMSLSWDRNRYTSDQARTALTLLSAIAFSDHKDPINLSHLSDEPSSSREAGSSADGGSSAQQDHHNYAMNGPPGSSNQHSNGNGNGQRGGTKRCAPDAAGGTATHKPPNPKKRRPKGALPSSVIAPGTQVACFDKLSDDDMWVLGRVVKYMPEARKYEVQDYDSEEQRYLVTRGNIRVIPKRGHSLDMTKPVLAIYPKTTVFYKARLMERRGKCWAVQFEDDELDSNKIKEVNASLVLQDCHIKD